MIHVTLSCLCRPSEDALCYVKLFVDRVMMLHVRLSFLCWPSKSVTCYIKSSFCWQSKDVTCYVMGFGWS